jgi:predicted metal-dependent hydrolase
MQSHSHAGMFNQVLQKRQVRLLINSFHDSVKIPYGLMRVNGEDEVNFVQDWAPLAGGLTVDRCRTKYPRNHRALLLCRVMSAKTKPARPAAKLKGKSPAYSRGGHTSFVTPATHKNESELFAHGVTLFNTRYFFEAHEAWEEIWLHTEPPEKRFLQGLIQVTAAFHHQSRDNLRGTASLLRAGLEKLDDFPPHHRGLQIEKLRVAVRRWLAALDRTGNISWPALPRIAPAPARR